MQRILTNNIYGVDIDVNAVEVTKLSLLLKVLEDENKDVLEQQQKLFQEKVLPNLSYNIKCGNSLIETDILEQEDLEYEELLKINPFNWEDEFPEIFENGGFDIVIGNPPWGAEFSERELVYLKEKNNEIVDRMINSFLYFIYISSLKLKQDGIFGMIIPDVIFYQNSYIPLRKFLLNNFSLTHIVNLGMGVFKKVNQPSAILIFRNNSYLSKKVYAKNLTDISKKKKGRYLNDNENYTIYSQSILNDLPNNVFITENIEYYSILNKIEKVSDLTLNDILGDDKKIQRGASPDLKEAFIIDKETVEKFDLEREKIKKMVSGGFQIKRYSINYEGQYLIYTTKNDNFRKLPNIRSFINSFKEDITCKEVKNGKHPIYSLHRPRKEEIFLKDKKIMGVITSDRLIMAIDENQLYATDGVYLFSTSEEFNPYFVLAVLNSNLFTFIYRLYSLENGRVLPQVKPSIIKNLPFKSIELNEQQKFIDSSHKMMELNKQLNKTKTPKEIKILEQQIEFTDMKINRLVYEVYGLTEEEINIVESSLN